MTKVSIYIVILLASGAGCAITEDLPHAQDLSGRHAVDLDQAWLSHEHVLVDFVGADRIRPDSWDHQTVLETVLPYFAALSDFNVGYFVDATPNYLGRDVLLLEKIAQETGIRIVTNTGLYGARDNEYVPRFAWDLDAEDLAQLWIDEFENGVDGTSIRPGFIKIGVDGSDILEPIDNNLVRAAAITHLQTGLPIASHTGEAKALWPQLTLLDNAGVSPSAFIWVHAHMENDNATYLKAAELGCWISLDGLGWEFDSHIEKLQYARENGILDKILISHDAGWFDPQRRTQSIKPYTRLFTELLPKLEHLGFTEDELAMLLRINPARAYSISVRPASSD